MKVPFATISVVLTLLPSVAFALTFERPSATLYHDVRVSSTDAVGITLLANEGIVHGYGNGFFGTSRLINRAEFLTMTLRMFPNLLGPWTDVQVRDCFPDVRAVDWFSRAVCYSKDLGLIDGYSDGLFHPERAVTYGEALKILTFFFTYDVLSPTGGHWAEPYYRASVAHGTDVSLRITLDTPLTRGRAAALAAAFLAESQGQLSEFRRAERGEFMSSSISSSASSSSSSSSASFSSSSSSVTSVGPSDQLTDKTPRSQFLLLGETGPMVAAANIFMDAEPLDVRTIAVNLNVASSSVQGFLVYDENRHYLGKATLDPTVSTNRRYALSVSPGTLTIEKRTSFAVYVRPFVLPKDISGKSNELIEVGNIVVEGTGVWSSQKYTKASTETYPTFVTSRSTITSMTNPLAVTAPLVLGVNQRVGSFRFEGRRTDSLAKIQVTDLVFTIGATAGVSLLNVQLTADGTSERFPCTVSATVVTCTSFPDTFGSLTDGPRTLTLYGDIASSNPTNATLQLTLNQAGSVVENGAVTWTDGTTTFHWLGLDGPLAAGTAYRY